MTGGGWGGPNPAEATAPIRTARGYRAPQFNYLGLTPPAAVPDVPVAPPPPPPAAAPATIDTITPTGGGAAVPARAAWDGGGEGTGAFGGGNTAGAGGAGTWVDPSNPNTMPMGTQLRDTIDIITDRLAPGLSNSSAGRAIAGAVAAALGFTGVPAPIVSNAGVVADISRNARAGVFDPSLFGSGVSSQRATGAAAQQAAAAALAAGQQPAQSPAFDANSLPGYGGMGRPSGQTGYSTTTPGRNAASPPVAGAPAAPNISIAAQSTPAPAAATAPAAPGAIPGAAPAPDITAPAQAPAAAPAPGAVPGATPATETGGTPYGTPAAPPGQPFDPNDIVGGMVPGQAPGVAPTPEPGVAPTPDLGFTDVIPGQVAQAPDPGIPDVGGMIPGGPAPDQAPAPAPDAVPDLGVMDVTPSGQEPAAGPAPDAAPSPDAAPDAAPGPDSSPGPDSGGGTPSGNADVQGGGDTDADGGGLYADGGAIEGGTPGVDSVDISAQQNEYVWSVPMVDALGFLLTGQHGPQAIAAAHQLLDEVQEAATGEAPNNSANDTGEGAEGEDPMMAGPPGGGMPPMPPGGAPPAMPPGTGAPPPAGPPGAPGGGQPGLEQLVQLIMAIIGQQGAGGAPGAPGGAPGAGTGAPTAGAGAPYPIPPGTPPSGSPQTMPMTMARGGRVMRPMPQAPRPSTTGAPPQAYVPPWQRNAPPPTKSPAKLGNPAASAKERRQAIAPDRARSIVAQSGRKGGPAKKGRA